MGEVVRISDYERRPKPERKPDQDAELYLIPDLLGLRKPEPKKD